MNNSSDTEPPVKSWPEPRPRRSHKKSRNGCSRCKVRRIKCDESLPKCSRCTKMNLSCQYPVRHGSSSQDTLQPMHQSEDTASPGTSSRHSTPSAAASPASFLRNYESPLNSQAAQTLAPIEFELLRHYLEHASRDAAANENDQYTVQIGIPNLACECKALMQSLLALAAICKCSDIIRQPFVSSEDRSQIVEMLALSHQYHMEALRQIQLTLHHETKTKYDHVLANAAMMGMYGSGSHSIRIWLTKTAPPGYAAEFHMPKHPQWISFYRAVDLAYAGLVNNNNSSSSSSSNQSQYPSPRPAPPEQQCSSPPPPSQPKPQTFSYKLSSSSRLEPPLSTSQIDPITNHPLSPILSATVGTALSKLSKRVQAVELSHPPTPELQSCFSALERLSAVVSDIFPSSPFSSSYFSSSSSTSSMSSSFSDSQYGHGACNITPRTPELPVLEVDVDPVGRLKEVSPWMRRYIASITYVIPSRLPRRIIAAFVHKVPTNYLGLVEDVFAFIDAEADDPCVMVELDVVHQLALDIFAHWLVLFIMLDNVWWIGGIGAWELGRVVAFMRRRKELMGMGMMGMGMGLGIEMEGEEDDWWPESMWEVSRQFDKHRSEPGSL